MSRSRVLDAGCQAGELTARLGAMHCRTVDSDLSHFITATRVTGSLTDLGEFLREAAKTQTNGITGRLNRKSA
jgi:2-polyprenyl-3-methyl-5-hydroxy-6-metoxy-1,4-benzoquinol methylase